MAYIFTATTGITLEKVIFAVVGHPNKGKSSIVSTLSQDDSINISGDSGTTKKATCYQVKTAHSDYELVDTPGFQRPTKVMAWLNQHAPTANLRAQAVSAFVADPQCQQQFPDEVELLTPLIKGAAILYVVDGSRPYGAEYEAEMEILRWTGRPSMALINPIESEQYVAEWERALTQYFKIVRVFNPMTADFTRQIELLQAFAHLNPNWAGTLNTITEDLQQQRITQKANSAMILSRLVEDLCFHRESQKVLNQQQAKIVQPTLEKKYKSWMQARENQAIRELFANYQHYQIKIDLSQLDFPPDLFDLDKWYAWGLTKQQLVSAAALAGAAAGVTLDIALAGHSLMLGAIGGGLAGFGSAWFGADRLAELKLHGLPLGGYEACFGPIKNRNFPYVVIGRFIHLSRQISERNHANRGQLSFAATDFQQNVISLEKSTQKALHQACDKLIKQQTVDDLQTILLPLL